MQLLLELAYLVLPFLTWTLASQCLNAGEGKFESPCPENNQSAELSFVTPIEQETLSTYPQKSVFTTLHHQVSLSCCATGYSRISWYKDGVELSPLSNDHSHCYLNDTTRQWIVWYSLESNSLVSSESFVLSTFMCEAFSADGTTSISNNASVLAIRLPGTENLPAFSPPVAVESCVEPGGDITIQCSLFYEKGDYTVSRRIALLDQNKTVIPLRTIGKNVFNATMLQAEGHLNATLHNVGEEQLNKTYYCQSVSHSSVRSEPIFISAGPCGVPGTARPVIETVTQESKLSIKIAVPLAALLVLLILTIMLVVKYNTYMNMWYRVHVAQRLKPRAQPDHYKYAAYMVYADVSHPAVSTLISTIEHRFQLKVCLPDRDFTVGAITPKLMSEGLRYSEKIIIFLSNEMFTPDETGTNWSDVSLSLALALNKPTIMIQLEDIDSGAVKKRRDLSAALKILKILNYSSPNYNQELSEALVTNFKFQI